MDDDSKRPPASSEGNEGSSRVPGTPTPTKASKRRKSDTISRIPVPPPLPNRRNSKQNSGTPSGPSPSVPPPPPLPSEIGSRRNAVTSNEFAPRVPPPPPGTGIPLPLPNAGMGSVRRNSITPAPNPSPTNTSPVTSPAAVSPTDSFSSVVQLNGSMVRRSSIPVGGAPSMGVVPVPSPPGSPCELPLPQKKRKVRLRKVMKLSKPSKVKSNYTILMSGTESESDASNIDSDVVKSFKDLTAHEEDVFAAVRMGSTARALELLRDDTWSFDYNIQNIYGYTILHMAIRRQDEAMVILILEEGETKLKPFVVQDALLHAVSENHMEIVLMLLSLMNRRGIPEKKHIAFPKERSNDFRKAREEMMDKEFYNSAFDDTTALYVAAQVDSYELIELFRQREYELNEPHLHTKPQWPESTCDLCQKLDDISRGNRRLHYYQAIYQPSYLCYRANYENDFDLILEAFNGIRKMRKLARIEEAYSKEYLQIADDLQDFTCSILQQCRSTEEVKAILKRRSESPVQNQDLEKNPILAKPPPPVKDYRERSHFPRLSYALVLELKDFVAHPHTQQIMFEYWAGDKWPSWRKMGTVMLIVHCIIRLLAWPILAILMLFVSPNTSIGGLIASPVSRFLNYMASYIMFLCFVCVIVLDEKATGDRGFPTTGVEWLVVIWVLGFTASMVRQALQRPRLHFSSLSTWYDLLTLCFFYASFISWLASWQHAEASIPRSHWDSTEPALIAEFIFAYASVLAFGRLLHVFQLSYSIGPLITSVGRMSKDVGNVLIFFVVAISAYALGLSRLYKAYVGWKENVNTTGISKEIEQPEDFLTFLDAVERLFWTTFGMGDRDATRIVHAEIHYPHKNETAKAQLDFTERTGKLMYYSFHILVSLILLNMMIGLMSNTYGEISGDGDKEWKFSATKIRMSYALDYINPSPFNLIPTPYCLFSICCPKVFKRKTPQKSNIDYISLLRTLVQRYFRDKAEITQTQEATTHDVERLGEDLDELRDMIQFPEEEERPLINLDTDTESEKEKEDESTSTPKSRKQPRKLIGKLSDIMQLGDKSQSDDESIADDESDPLPLNDPSRRDSNSRNVHFNI